MTRHQINKITYDTRPHLVNFYLRNIFSQDSYHHLRHSVLVCSVRLAVSLSDC